MNAYNVGKLRVSETRTAQGRAVRTRHRLARQGVYVSSIEEIAYRTGYIDSAQLVKLAEPLAKMDYGKYLLQAAEDCARGRPICSRAA